MIADYRGYLRPEDAAGGGVLSMISHDCVKPTNAIASSSGRDATALSPIWQQQKAQSNDLLPMKRTTSTVPSTGRPFVPRPLRHPAPSGSVFSGFSPISGPVTLARRFLRDRKRWLYFAVQTENPGYKIHTVRHP